MTLRTTLASGALLLALSPSPLTAQTPTGDPTTDGSPSYDAGSSVQVQVTPRQTQVYIDGYYAGVADDYDGVFQRLHIEPGAHQIQLFLGGYRLFAQQVYLQPGGSFKIKHAMERLAAGEAEPSRPAAPPQPPKPRGAVPTRPPTPTAPVPDEQAQDDADRDGQAAGSSSAARGALDIQVQPSDAQVYVDNERWNTTGDDHLLVQLTPGPHTVEVRKRGYRIYLTEVLVKGGETLPLTIALTKEQ